MRALLRAMHVSRRKHEEGQHVVMTAGQMVEALFVVHAEVRGTQEFLLRGKTKFAQGPRAESESQLEAS